jgi:anti-anti-sigma factor
VSALPARDRESLNLSCDKCGQRLSGISSTLRDWSVVWTLISGHGWTGSPLAFGPHYCPGCTATAQREIPSDPEVPAPAPHVRWRASIWTEGDAAVIDLHGDLDVLTADSLRQVLAGACEDHRDVVLDLADVRLIDSTALGVLARVHQTMKSKGGHVCLAAPSKFIVTALQTMRLLPVFPIFGSSQQAVEWIAAGCP